MDIDGLVFLIWSLYFSIVEAKIITFCPCMGRFGNQLDHVTSMLHKSKEMKTTLLLPSFISYEESPLALIPFENVFEVSALIEGGFDVLAASEFDFDRLTTILCHRESMTFSGDHNGATASCDLSGNPRGTYWRQLGVKFLKSDVVSALEFHDEPVALTGAITAFPAPQSVNYVHQYLRFAPNILKIAYEIVQRIGSPFLGIHLRLGDDFRSACEILDRNENCMASPQCGTPVVKLDKIKHCIPPMEQILDELDLFREKFATIYISSDKKIDKKIFKKRGFRVTTLDDYRDLSIPKFFDPLIDLAVQILSDYFIGNCVSSFTGFIVRQRRVKHLPVDFWGLVEYLDTHDEL
ncbi:unnamed protein product [Oikopleura dioica]|uniref:GDP-fucose protein O-fucosyltransferase 1 n=1 Tax=Oikopleura dioica TaxID=34765 RepID=E4X350_OIKDI|nr:unnamed protein product [Oikopleura dioica]